MSAMKTNIDLQFEIVRLQGLLLGCLSFLKELKETTQEDYTRAMVSRLIEQIERHEKP